MKTAEEFAKEYYQLDKSGIESVRIKSAIRFAERYAEEVVKNISSKQVVSRRNANDELIECRNCGDKVKMISSGEFCPHCFC